MRYILYPIHEYSVELPKYFVSYIDAVMFGIRAYGSNNFIVDRQIIKEN